jgi:hypothetical protein
MSQWPCFRYFVQLIHYVFDMVSLNFDQDCVSEVNYCDNCSRLKDYVKVSLMELKSSHQIIRYYMKIKEIHITSKVKKTLKT